RACLDTARVCLDAAHDGTEFDMPSMVRRLVELADDVRLGPSSRAIVSAAVARGIPFRRLNSGSLVQLGEGARQRRIWTAETDATSAIAESIAQDKELTKRLLHAVGVPVPLGRPVHSAEDACEAAREIGPPVAVKPRKANHARGITLDISTEEQIQAAYDWAVQDGENTGVLVEQYVRGYAHRLLVVGERLVAAARGESEFVTGDGQRTVRELVDEENRDPRRGENYTDLLNLLKLDAAAEIELKKQGLTPDSVPAKGRKVLVHHVGDLTTDCTEQVHPDNARKAVLAARTIGLDIAGLDVIAEDISVPLEAQRGAVLEVNAGPGLSQHVAPLHGKPQPVGKAIVDLLFEPGANGRIPIIAVGGPGDRARLAEVIDERLRGVGLRVARATSAGLFYDGLRTNAAHSSDSAQVESLLVHPYADAVVFESRPQQAAAHGLGCERVDIAVLAGFSTTPAAAISEGREDRRVDALTMQHAIQTLLNAVPPAGSYFVPPESQPGEALKLPRAQRRAWTSLDELADGVCCAAANGRSG
ncbi:MAG TPA: acetate--CoA ligase family protein, partial [Pirellulaceae bacterium]|nr:acetate--CoA ligase family protein [Pirellulaceae bacterium]